MSAHGVTKSAVLNENKLTIGSSFYLIAKLEVGIPKNG